MKMEKTEITDELLLANGFKYDIEPHNNLTGLHCQQGDWRIMIAKGYDSDNNFGCVRCDCWLGDGTGSKIVRRSCVHGSVDRMEDIQNAIDMCRIPKTLALQTGEKEGAE